MSEDKQCLQRDTTEGRCLEEGCGKNMPDVCFDLTAYETSRWLELKQDRENVDAQRNWKHYLWHKRNARLSTS